jgi:hypothetical protein
MNEAPIFQIVMAVPGLDPGISTAISLLRFERDSRVKPANDGIKRSWALSFDLAPDRMGLNRTAVGQAR